MRNEQDWKKHEHTFWKENNLTVDDFLFRSHPDIRAKNKSKEFNEAFIGYINRLTKEAEQKALVCLEGDETAEEILKHADSKCDGYAQLLRYNEIYIKEELGMDVILQGGFGLDMFFMKEKGKLRKKSYYALHPIKRDKWQVYLTEIQETRNKLDELKKDILEKGGVEILKWRAAGEYLKGNFAAAEILGTTEFVSEENILHKLDE